MSKLEIKKSRFNFVSWPDYIFEKQNRKRHWINQSSFRYTDIN